jgi:hypothetical protein
VATQEGGGAFAAAIVAEVVGVTMLGVMVAAMTTVQVLQAAKTGKRMMAEPSDSTWNANILIVGARSSRHAPLLHPHSSPHFPYYRPPSEHRKPWS